MGHLFKKPHHKFKFVFRNDSGHVHLSKELLRTLAAALSAACLAWDQGQPLTAKHEGEGWNGGDNAVAAGGDVVESVGGG